MLRTAALVLTLTLAAAQVACGKDRALAGPGGACDLAQDCAAGLICVPVEGAGRVCSNDLTGVTGDTPDPSERPDGGEGDAATEAPPTPTDGGNTPDDAGDQDAGTIIDAALD